MAKRSTPKDLVSVYDAAKKRDPTLTPKAFLDIVAPSDRGRSEKSSRDYLRRIRSGERSGTKLLERAYKDSGKVVKADYQTKEGMKGANVTIPLGRSRLDLFRPGKLRAAVNRSLERTYADRLTKRSKTYEPIKQLPRGSKLAAVQSVLYHTVVSEPLR